MKSNFFKRRREELGVTQRVIAERLRMTCASVSGWERGEAIPELRVVPQLAEVYAVSEPRLLREMLKLATLDASPSHSCALAAS